MRYIRHKDLFCEKFRSFSYLVALQKNKREICKDKQILMISRFYKPAFVIIIVFFGCIINEREEKMQEKFI